MERSLPFSPASHQVSSCVGSCGSAERTAELSACLCVSRCRSSLSPFPHGVRQRYDPGEQRSFTHPLTRGPTNFVGERPSESLRLGSTDGHLPGRLPPLVLVQRLYQMFAGLITTAFVFFLTWTPFFLTLPGLFLSIRSGALAWLAHGDLGSPGAVVDVSRPMTMREGICWDIVIFTGYSARDTDREFSSLSSL